MTKFFMMIGLPGSGKSTYANKIAEEENAIVCSSDALRKELYGSEGVQEHNEEVFQILMQRVINYLKEGKSVIFDAQNISSKYRRNTLQMISNIGCKKIAVIIATPYEQCLAQNSARERHVPEYVIKKSYMNFTVPCKQEGFDDIKIIYPENFEAKNFLAQVALYKNLSHDNPHHSETIGNHMQLAYNYFINNYPGESAFLGLATFLHDIGKPFTKVFTNYKGDPAEIAHYYGHNNVGAYEIIQLFPHFKTNIVIEMALLVQYHMNYYISWAQSEKSFEKDYKFLGKEFMRKLSILHECDKNAH